MQKQIRLFVVLTALILSMLACSIFQPKTTPPTDAPAAATKVIAPTKAAAPTEAPAASPTEESQPTVQTEFPLPADASDVMELTGGGVNFKTKMSIKEAIAFYREAFKKEGYTEREITTTISDTVFSIVFDGHASGKAIVVQGVVLGDGVLNLNIRFEDV
jgi:hypothetical protein